MSGGALVGVALVLAGAAVWSWGSVVAVRANPGERVPRPGNQRRGSERGAYFAGFVCAIVGGLQLNDAYGWWGYAGAVLVFAAPTVIITTVHNRRLRRAPSR